MKYFNFLFVLSLALSISACESQPKVVESAPPADGSSSIFKDVATAQTTANTTEHKVVVKEVLNTDKYSYLSVTENGEDYWIAIPKSKVEVGETYIYRGGLLKKNFQSREFNRVFETVYLVSDIRKENGGSALDKAMSQLQGAETDDGPIKVEPAEGAITIAELVNNAAKYGGKVVKVTGKVVKLNPMIMNRNWVHLRDGSDEEHDLTVTTTENVSMGQVVTFEGTIGLDRDFGAGYRYDIIMEGAVLK
ncbi:MAG: GW dipeptide domain-containing protein [Saprospiraceae bacterium]